MSEPIQAPPAQPGQATPPPAAPEQTPQTPPAGTPPAASTPPATPPVAPAAIAPSPELTAFKAEVEQLRKTNLEAQRKITQQGQFIAQQLNQPAPQPKQDPLEPYVKMLVAKGYNPQEARDVAEVQWAMNEPIRQAQQQAQQSIHATSMVSEVMREAWTEKPQVFAAHPEIGQRVEQMLRQNAITGQGPVDKEYALALAKIEWFDRTQGGAQQQPVPQNQPPSFHSMYAPSPGFTAPTPTQQAAPQLTAEQEKWNADFKRLYTPKTA